MSKPLVSVVVPCYNVEKKIIPLLESILRQTYTNLELIFVNDGSTDATEEVIFSYEKKFRQKGMLFIYKYQLNRGPGAATETGFKMVSGDYLIWPDADDWLDDNSVKVRVEFLEKNPGFSCVSSDLFMYKESDLSNPIGRISVGREGYLSDENQFENLIKYKAVFNPGPHMIRMSDMDKVNPNRLLYPSRTGQNVQLLLPISYKMKRAYINIPLYNYVIYSDSLSRKDYETISKGYDTFDKLKNIYEETLNYIEMPRDEKEKYLRMIYDANIEQKYYFAYEHKDFKYEKELYCILKQRNALNSGISKLHKFKYLWWLKKLYHLGKNCFIKKGY